MSATTELGTLPAREVTWTCALFCFSMALDVVVRTVFRVGLPLAAPAPTPVLKRTVERSANADRPREVRRREVMANSLEGIAGRTPSRDPFCAEPGATH